MSEIKLTPKQLVAEQQASGLEGRRFVLISEKAQLLQAATRIVDIDAEVAEIDATLAALAPNRPPKPPTIPAADFELKTTPDQIP